MPIFEYKCKECGKLTEVLVSSAAAKKPLCEHCGSTKTEKQFSSFAPRVINPAAGDCSACSNAACPHAGR